MSVSILQSLVKEKKKARLGIQIPRVGKSAKDRERNFLAARGIKLNGKQRRFRFNYIGAGKVKMRETLFLENDSDVSMEILERV